MSNSFNPYTASNAEPIAMPANVVQGELADRGMRLLGSIIDGVIIMPIVLPLALLLGVGLGIMFGDGMLTNLLATVFGAIIGIGGFLAVHGYLLAKYGQTVGKKLLNMRIVGDDGRQLPFQELVLKRYLPLWIASSVPYLGMLAVIIDALAIFRENRKCIHDEIAKTKVIKV